MNGLFEKKRVRNTDIKVPVCCASVCLCIFFYISVVFLPQNNVSILLKWSLVRLLMLLRIKLYRSNGMDLFTFWAQRHHVKIGKRHISPVLCRFHVLPFRFSFLSSQHNKCERHINSITSHAAYTCLFNQWKCLMMRIVKCSFILAAIPFVYE